MCSARERRNERMPSSATRRPSPRYGVAVKKNNCPPRSRQSVNDLRQDIGRGMVGLVNEKGLSGELLGKVVAREPVQCRVGTSKSVVERSWLAKVVDDPPHRAESAFPGSLDQSSVSL